MEDVQVCQIRCQIECQIEGQSICQEECQRECQKGYAIIHLQVVRQKLCQKSVSGLYVNKQMNFTLFRSFMFLKFSFSTFLSLSQGWAFAGRGWVGHFDLQI